MSIHNLKTDPEVFEAVYQGVKTYEIRYDDRHFQVADILHLLETKFTGSEMANEDAPLLFTGRELYVAVTHKLSGPIYGLKDGWCILSIKHLR